MKYLLPILSLTVLPLGAVDFVPEFPSDKPVPQAQLAHIEQALPSAPIVTPKAARRILVVSSTAGFRHASIPTGKVAIEKLGAVTGAYEAVISDDPANFEPDVLKTFDAVLLLNTTQDFFMPNRKKKGAYSAADWNALQARHNQMIDNLIAYVQQGGGLAGIHAATDTCYGHKGYGDAIGAYFWGHPWNANSHVTIVVEDPKHAVIEPVFQGMQDFRVRDEIYQFRPEPYSRERLRILLHLDPERSDAPKSKPRREDNDYPVCWVQQVGKGRVFYTSLGHNHEMYWNPLILKHYLAGLQFACGDIEGDTTPSAQIEMPNVSGCCGQHSAE